MTLDQFPAHCEVFEAMSQHTDPMLAEGYRRKLTEALTLVGEVRFDLSQEIDTNGQTQLMAVYSKSRDAYCKLIEALSHLSDTLQTRQFENQQVSKDLDR